MAHRAALVLIGLLTVVVYAPLYGSGYVYEDPLVLAAQGDGRALTMATVRISADPGVQHVVSVAIHLLNGGLVYLLAGLVAPNLALVLTAVFLWHPLAIEAVAALGGRGDLLLLTGLLLTALGAMRAWWVVMAFGVVIALGAKELGLIALPLAWLGLWRAVEIKRTLIAASAVVAVAGLWWVRDGLWAWLTLSPLPWAEFAGRQIVQVWTLFGLSMWPVGLSIDHDPLAVPLAARVVTGVATVVLIALFAWSVARAWTLALALGWIALVIAPRFVVFGVETIHERQFYPALPGVLLALGILGLHGWNCLTALWDYAHYQPHKGLTL